MKHQDSFLWFLLKVVALAAIAMIGIQKMVPYFNLFSGVRVEYDSGAGWKEIQQTGLSADVREINVKRITQDVPSLDWEPWPASGGIHSDDTDGQTETYLFSAASPVQALTVLRSREGILSLISVTTHHGIKIPIFNDGVCLGDGVYSVSTKEGISPGGIFKIENGTLDFPKG